MKNYFIADYCAYTAFKILGPVFRLFPVRVSIFSGKILGGLLYCLDRKHRSRVYANLKTAFGEKFSRSELRRITRKFYLRFGQNLIEIFLMPKVNRAYIEKYVTVEGREHIDAAFKKGKGVIFVGVHAGSWELSNLISANLGFPFSLLVRDQRYPRLGALLNAYRRQKGCRILERENQTRDLIEALKNNEAIGMTADQGGRSGILVDFFGKEASMPYGAIRMAMKYGAAVLPAIYVRVKGPYIKTVIAPELEIRQTGDREADIKENLQRLVRIFEKYIAEYPHEYLWSYKVWKYGRQKNILVIGDGVTGHLRQAQAVAGIARDAFTGKGMAAAISTIEAGFKSKFRAKALAFFSSLSGRFPSRLCLWFLKKALKDEAYAGLTRAKPDIVISCGSTVAALNYITAAENSAKSIAVMRPSILSARKFDLLVVPSHDRMPGKNNIVVTEGALNLITGEYLRQQGLALRAEVKIGEKPFVGMLIGGDTKDFRLEAGLVREASRRVKAALEELDAEIIVSTSRRTPLEVEALLKEEFQGYPRCKLLLIANERNPAFAVGGILDLSRVVIVSPESISMISEAVSSAKYVLAFDAPGIKPRHRRFLELFTGKGYLYLAESQDLGKKISEIWTRKPPVNVLQDSLRVGEAIGKIL